MPRSVSVLLVNRNPGQDVLEEAKSVLEQPECLELIVVKWNSSINRLQLMEDLATSDSRVRIISTRISCAADALNTAFSAARGTLIGWLNSGQIYSDGALARAVAELELHQRPLDSLVVFRRQRTPTQALQHMPRGGAVRVCLARAECSRQGKTASETRPALPAGCTFQ